MNRKQLDALNIILEHSREVEERLEAAGNEEEAERVLTSSCLLTDYYQEQCAARYTERQLIQGCVLAAIAGIVVGILFFFPEIVRGARVIWWN